MANQREIGLTYNWMHRFFPRIFGENADISCAFYDGDFSKSLEQAQLDKHTGSYLVLALKQDKKSWTSALAGVISYMLLSSEVAMLSA